MFDKYKLSSESPFLFRYHPKFETYIQKEE